MDYGLYKFHIYYIGPTVRFDFQPNLVFVCPKWGKTLSACSLIYILSFILGCKSNGPPKELLSKKVKRAAKADIADNTTTTGIFYLSE